MAFFLVFVPKRFVGLSIKKISPPLALHQWHESFLLAPPCREVPLGLRPSPPAPARASTSHCPRGRLAGTRWRWRCRSSTSRRWWTAGWRRSPRSTRRDGPALIPLSWADLRLRFIHVSFSSFSIMISFRASFMYHTKAFASHMCMRLMCVTPQKICILNPMFPKA